VILGGGVAVCLLLSAHRAVIFAIAQLSCTSHSTQNRSPRRRPSSSQSVGRCRRNETQRKRSRNTEKANCRNT